jgi:hypothetical protein
MAVVTVMLAVPATDPRVAVIVAWPEDRPLETPPEAIVATAGAEELQLADIVTSCWLPSLNAPVAVNCRVVPATTLGCTGLTAMDKSVGEVTVKREEPAIEPAVAVIVA